jgi:hypothetical protein
MEQPRLDEAGRFGRIAELRDAQLLTEDEFQANALKSGTGFSSPRSGRQRQGPNLR